MSSIAVQGGATGSGTVTLLAPITNTNRTLTLPDATGTVLSSATTTGFPAGSVLQVVNAIYSTATSNSTSTFADTGLTATITPTSATSKILVLISHPTNTKSNGNVANDLGLRLLQGATVLSVFNKSLGYSGTTILSYFSASFNYLDSPATTSAITYKTQFRNDDVNGASVTVQADTTPSTITLMEIAA